MRSLSFKLTLTFLLTSLVGIIVALIIIQQRTRSEFDRFLLNREQNELVTMLTQYYQSNGSWEGLQEELSQRYPWRMVQEQPGYPPPDMNNRQMMERLPLVLVDNRGKFILGNPTMVKAPLTRNEVEKGIEIQVDGKSVGWILVSPGVPMRRFEFPERSFLRNVNQAILISAIIAMGIALLLGGTLAKTLTKPLRELTKATQLVAQGELGYKVAVNSDDEIGELATSFNQMSADLAESTQLRRQMTADIAHDLRTPVSVILGYAEALSDGKLQGSPEIFSVIHQETGRLSRLIDDLRTISLADAGELPLNLQDISPLSLIDQSYMAFMPQALQKEIELIRETPPNLPLVRVDADRMAQVLGNLISNALRFTPPGGWIKLSTSLGENEKMVTLQVSDNGSGIPVEDLPLVFNRFYRGDKSRQTNRGETGLGLTISRSLVEAQGGNISVESAPGKGTAFTIRFPVG